MKLVRCDPHPLILIPFFIYIFNLLFKPFLRQEHTNQVSGQATKNFDLLALSMSLFLVCHWSPTSPRHGHHAFTPQILSGYTLLGLLTFFCA